jgi:hypothetical protein
MYTDKITMERQEAHNANVANKIIDMMDKLRLSANSSSPRRWVWELLQNAKDVSNLSGKVKVKINLNAESRVLEFSHNGKPFSTKNIVFLIEQVSTKDRDIDNSGKQEKATGKFGTGFLTTHLLSEIVTVNGYLEDEHEPLRNFEVTIDRAGKSKDKIIGSIHEAFKQLEKSTIVIEPELHDPDDYNTVFRYSLDEKGIEVAKVGIEDLKISIPYVMALNPQIEEVTIESEDITYSVIKKLKCGLENSKIFKMQESQGGNKKYYFVLLVEDHPVKVAVTIEKLGEKVWIKPFDKKQPKIFCDFPLVGTDDFPFPIIVDSESFNPTEPRDGIFLTNIDNDKVEENKILILKACELYYTLLSYAAENDWLSLYNATNIKRVNHKDWYSTDWLKDNVVDKIKHYIKYCPIIDNVFGDRIALFNNKGEIQVQIPSHFNDQIRYSMWELCQKWIPKELPRKEDINNWYESLWSECKTFDLESLTKRIEGIDGLEALTIDIVDGYEPDAWLNEFYKIARRDKKMFEDIFSGKYAVIPNQNGIFKKNTELLIDDNIDEEYKEILNLLGEDCKEYLFDKNIELANFAGYRKIDNENLLGKIEEGLRWASDELEEKVYSRILVLYEETREQEKQDNIKLFAVKILGDFYYEKKYVKSISIELLEKSIRNVAKRIADEISVRESITNFTNHFYFISNEEALNWLGEFIDYLVKHDYDNLINKSKKPILPNQNGFFVTKDDVFLDDGEIDEGLKDIATECGYDIRKELLDNNIFLVLPENREKHSKDLAEPILTFVKDKAANRMNLSKEIKFIFKKIFIWMDENLELARRIFPELCENKHWLYDDKEVASNMKKAEVYDVLLEKYGIKDSGVLEKILQDRSSNKIDVVTKENITEDLLIQSGIYSGESLEEAMGNPFFSENFLHLSESDRLKFDYVKQILERSKNNVLTHLESKKEYDLSSKLEIDKTIYLIQKNGEDVYIIIRPSDYEQVILYYESEKDILDYEKDWELWVEDGIKKPQRITFGKMLKLTGINKIPLRRGR